MTVEEVDDEVCLEAHAKPKSATHLLYNMNKEREEEKPSMTKHPTLKSDNRFDSTDDQCTDIEEINVEPFVIPDHYTSALASESRESPFDENTPSNGEPSQGFRLPPPPKEIKPVRMPKKRFYPTGESSVGVSILSVKGWVGNLDNPLMDLRLDSCADVTLISSEFYDSLKANPPIQQGVRMRLWQLTDKDSKLKGFVRIPVYMLTDDGVTIESEAEAYVVPGMTVPILLGEDYQLTYELGVTRNVEEGPRVRFGKFDYKITARQVERTRDFDRMRQSAHSVGRFIRSKLHRRRKNKRHRQKVKFGVEGNVVRVKEDTQLRLTSVNLFKLKVSWAKIATGWSRRICSLDQITLASLFQIPSSQPVTHGYWFLTPQIVLDTFGKERLSAFCQIQQNILIMLRQWQIGKLAPNTLML